MDHHLEIVLSKESAVEVSSRTVSKRMTDLVFRSLKDIHTISSTGLISVFAVVAHFGDVTSSNTQAEAARQEVTPLERQEVILTDDSNSSITLVLWKGRVDYPEMTGAIFELTRVTISARNGGVQLGLSELFNIDFSVSTYRAKELNEWL